MKGEDKTTYVYGTPGKQSKESRRNKKTGIEEEKSESIPVLCAQSSTPSSHHAGPAKGPVPMLQPGGPV